MYEILKFNKKYDIKNPLIMENVKWQRGQMEQ